MKFILRKTAAILMAVLCAIFGLSAFAILTGGELALIIVAIMTLIKVPEITFLVIVFSVLLCSFRFALLLLGGGLLAFLCYKCGQFVDKIYAPIKRAETIEKLNAKYGKKFVKKLSGTLK